jgi:hypothetical protein
MPLDDAGYTIKLEAADILDLMLADLSRPYGWCKGKLENKRGGRCISGAFNLAVYGQASPMLTSEVLSLRSSPQAELARRSIHQALAEVMATSLSELQIVPSRFNDDKATKKKDVLALLRRAREIAQHGPTRRLYEGA